MKRKAEKLRNHEVRVRKLLHLILAEPYVEKREVLSEKLFRLLKREQRPFKPGPCPRVRWGLRLWRAQT